MLALLVSKSQWNESALSARFPSFHPTRASWIADAVLKAEASARLIFHHESASVGSLQSDLSMIVSSANMARLFELLDLDQYCPWAISSRQKSECLEQMVGLVILMEHASVPAWELPEGITSEQLVSHVTDALILLAKSVERISEQLMTSLVESFSLAFRSKGPVS